MSVTTASADASDRIDRFEVVSQLERMLSSSHFRASRRSSSFLRYVVLQTLDGLQDNLKERTLGIEVFQREPTFDTSSDCIVRVSASEVRKRIAQYYQEQGRQQELRIELPLGTYVPQFHKQEPPAPVAAQAAVVAPAESAPEPPAEASEAEAPGRESTRRGWLIWAAGAGVVLVVAAVVLLGVLRARHPKRDLLAPFLTGSQPTAICIGVPELKQNQPGADTPEEQAALGPPAMNNVLIPLADAEALSGAQGLLNAHHHPSRLLLSSTATFDSLRSGPTILIAAEDNPWTIRLTANWRFYFTGSQGTATTIVDRETGQRWKADFAVPFAQRAEDFAIVSISQDETLGQPLMVLAGAGPNGTMAASEFLLNEEHLGEILKQAPANWNGRNFEAVIEAQVIAGVSGPPRILAVHFW